MRYFAEILHQYHYLWPRLSSNNLYVDFRDSGGINKKFIRFFEYFVAFSSFGFRKSDFFRNFHGKTRFSNFWKNGFFKFWNFWPGNENINFQGVNIARKLIFLGFFAIESFSRHIILLNSTKTVFQDNLGHKYMRICWI